MRDRVATVLIVCGVIGAIVGLCHAEMQDAVEIAQVHAGVVPFAVTDPFYVFAMRLWSLQHQIAALMLHWGVSERAVSALMSAGMGALTFQALGVTALAAGARTSIACAAPGAILALGLARGGIAYPILPFGTEFGYGSIGLSLTMLGIALVAAGSLRRGAFLIALLPAVHASLGAAAWAIIAVAAIARPAVRADLWSARRWVVAGVACVAISLAIQWWRLPAVSASDWAVAPTFADVIMRSWDVHRQLRAIAPIHLLAVVCSILVAAVIFLRRRRWLTPRAELLPVFVLATTIAGVVIHLAYAFAPAAIPRWIMVSMPGRLANFSLFSAAAMAAGVSERVALFQSRRMRLAVVLTLALITGGFVASGIAAAPKWWAADMAVAANDPFYARVAQGREALLTGSNISGMQRRTRRPLVLNGIWIDALPYAPESAAGVNRALGALYGVDLLHPPANSLEGFGSLPFETARPLWEGRSPDEWRRLGRDWHFDQIVTYEDWSLRLPRAATGHGLSLFLIPRD